MFGKKNASGYRSQPARTREGQAYPGGRHMRRALRNLATRRDGDQGPGHHTPDSHRGSQQNYATAPGSMKGRS